MPLLQPTLTKQGTSEDFYARVGAGGDITATQFSVVATPGGPVRAQVGSNGTNGYVACASGQKLYFGGVAGLPGQSYIQPSASTNQDALVIGGSVSTQQLKLNTSGAAAVMGSGTLLNGAATINTTACLGVNSVIMVTRTNVNASTALGVLRVRAKNVGFFLVEASTLTTPPALGAELGDQSDFDWIVVNPA